MRKKKSEKSICGYLEVVFPMLQYGHTYMTKTDQIDNFKQPTFIIRKEQRKMQAIKTTQNNY